MSFRRRGIINPKENVLSAIRHDEPEWIPCPMVDGSIRVVFHNLIEYPEDYGYDDWKVKWDRGEDKSGAGMPKEFPIKRPEQVENFPLPDPEREMLFSNAIEEIEKIDRSKCFVLGDNGWGIFERAWLLTGMERLLMWMYKEPEAVRTLMYRVAEIKARISERFLKEVKVDGVRYGDDWGGEQSLLMGPKLWRKFIKPGQRKLYDVCKDNEGLIFQHSDGHIEEIIPDLIEMGLDILNPLQPESNDVIYIKNMYGDKLTFHGVISSRKLDKGSSEEIDEEVKMRIKQLSSDGGYILAPAHGLSYPEENLEAFRKAAIKYGKIPETWICKYTTGRGDVEV